MHFIHVSLLRISFRFFFHSSILQIEKCTWCGTSALWVSVKCHRGFPALAFLDIVISVDRSHGNNFNRKEGDVNVCSFPPARECNEILPSLQD